MIDASGQVPSGAPVKPQLLPLGPEKSERGGMMDRAACYPKRGVIIFIFLATGTALLLSIPVISDVLIDRLQIFPALTISEIAKRSEGNPTAIVILSAGRRVYAPEFGGETVDELALERIRYGAELQRKTHLPILVSGGMGNDEDPPHAQLMTEVLQHDFDVPVKWQESSSASTAQNAIYSSRLLKQAGINRVVLVTHAWHMKRASSAFMANGMTVIPAPTAFYGRIKREDLNAILPSMRALRMSGYAVHEMLGSGWYALRYGY
jgi:uncharacterized SAM-binding protein YcdF (DUF218 family)